MLLVTIIVGIATAIATPSLVASRRDNEAKEVFTQIRGALIQAQAEANRISGNCGISINGTQVTQSAGSSADCRVSSFQIDDGDSDVVSVTSSGNPSDITFTFRGTTNDGQALFITRIQGSSPDLDAARCIVISNVGMIRTGVYNANADADCENSENKRYDSFNP